MPDELLELRNLGKTSVRWLNAIGVKNLEQLRTRGAVATYCAVKARGFNVNKVLLYALHGALEDTHWSELSQEVKDDLLRQADQLSS